MKNDFSDEIQENYIPTEPPKQPGCWTAFCEQNNGKIK